MKLFFASLLIAFLFTPSFGISRPITDDDLGHEEALDEWPAKSKYVHFESTPPGGTVLGIAFKKNLALNDVIKKLGNAKTVETGDAAAFEAKVNYAVGQNEKKNIISFVSGEMGGRKYITIIRIFNPRFCKLKSDQCSTLKEVSKISFENGLKLGMERELVVKLLGKPDKDSSTGWYYYYQVKNTALKMQQKYFAYYSLNIKFEGNKTVLIQVEKGDQ